MKPFVKNIITNEVHKTTVRRLFEHDLDEIMRVQQLAVDAVSDSATYVESTKEDFLNILGHGEIYGLFANGELCGVCAFCRGVYGENLGADIELTEEQCEQSVVLECYFVSPDYRGNGIARELANICVTRAVESFGAKYVLATISPKNIGSLLSMMSVNGFRIKALRQKYGCKLRYILCYTYKDPKVYTYYERFSVFDVYGISRALADKFEGIATFRSQDGIFLWMAK